jgi:hypothetical protein
MKKQIKVADLPEFDALPYLDNEVSVAAYLIDILETNDTGLLAEALVDIARSRVNLGEFVGWGATPASTLGQPPMLGLKECALAGAHRYAGEVHAPRNPCSTPSLQNLIAASPNNETAQNDD